MCLRVGHWSGVWLERPQHQALKAGAPLPLPLPLPEPPPLPAGRPWSAEEVMCSMQHGEWRMEWLGWRADRSRLQPGCSEACLQQSRSLHMGPAACLLVERACMLFITHVMPRPHRTRWLPPHPPPRPAYAHRITRISTWACAGSALQASRPAVGARHSSRTRGRLAAASKTGEAATCCCCCC